MDMITIQTYIADPFGIDGCQDAFSDIILSNGTDSNLTILSGTIFAYLACDPHQEDDATFDWEQFLNDAAIETDLKDPSDGKSTCRQ